MVSWGQPCILTHVAYHFLFLPCVHAMPAKCSRRSRSGIYTIHSFLLHLIVAVIGIYFEEKIFFWVRDHFDLVPVIDEVAVVKVSSN